MMGKMTFNKYFLILLVITAILAGCGGAGNSTVSQEAEATSSAVAGPLKTDYENALPINLQLALGLFTLDETATPLKSEQAAALVPLWKAYRNLTTGEGSSKEIEALIIQIQETLTADQLKAIADKRLTMQDLMRLAQEKNLALGGGGGPNLSAEERATRQAQRFSGQGGGSGGPGPNIMIGPGGFEPGGMGPGGEMPPGAMATSGARQTAIAQRPAGFDVQVSPALVEALIDFLETKAQ
jgi:hypothetical protein